MDMKGQIQIRIDFGLSRTGKILNVVFQIEKRVLGAEGGVGGVCVNISMQSNYKILEVFLTFRVKDLCLRF